MTGTASSLRKWLYGVYVLDLQRGEEALLYAGDKAPDPKIAPMPAEKDKCNRYGLK